MSPCTSEPVDARLAWPTVEPALTVDSPLTVEPALVVGVAGAVSGCTTGATLTVGAAVVVGAGLVVVVDWPLQPLDGPVQLAGGTAGVRTVVDVVEVDVVDVDVVVVGKWQF